MSNKICSITGDKIFKDMGLLINANGEILDIIDNNKNYDIDENYNFIDIEGNIVATYKIDKVNSYIYWFNANGDIIDKDPFGKALPTAEDKVNGTILPAYEKRGIDTSPVRNGTLTLEQFEKSIKNQEMKETFLFAGIVIIIILLIAILNKKKQ